MNWNETKHRITEQLNQNSNNMSDFWQQNFPVSKDRVIWCTSFYSYFCHNISYFEKCVVQIKIISFKFPTYTELYHQIYMQRYIFLVTFSSLKLKYWFTYVCRCIYVIGHPTLLFWGLLNSPYYTGQRQRHIYLRIFVIVFEILIYFSSIRFVVYICHDIAVYHSY